jgi:hypothetical protein
MRAGRMIRLSGILVGRRYILAQERCIPVGRSIAAGLRRGLAMARFMLAAEWGTPISRQLAMAVVHTLAGAARILGVAVVTSTKRLPGASA